MNIEEYREYCLSVKGSTESFPFDEYVLVFKIMRKMFSYASLRPKDGRFFANVKCDPERSAYLREHYDGISPGYHSDKRYWISIYLESDVPDNLIRELINHSVEEVVKKLPKNKQEEYRQLWGPTNRNNKY